MDIVTEIKSQYTRVLQHSDWLQFKNVAEYYLEAAARLKKKDIKSQSNKLLLRNSQKRLFIGIGCELLLKAFYLKKGYCINKLNSSFSGKKLPVHKLSSLKKNDINDKNTFTLDPLVNHLITISTLKSHKEIKRGFQIAMAFRNKEGHVTFPSHSFDIQNYRDVEKAIMLFYQEGFKEKLSYKISMQPNEKSRFAK